MNYHIQIQSTIFEKGTLGFVMADVVPSIGDWINLPDAPEKNFEVKNRLFRYDSKSKQIQAPKEEYPIAVLYVEEVPEKTSASSGQTAMVY